MSFLTAEWRRLAFANYEVDPKSLQKYLPARTELDTYNSIHYASLVGFLFKKVRVLGVKVPYHVTFEEVNLRFYVRYKANGVWRRGVVFVKEIVPKRAIVLVANTLYHENYEKQKMSHLWKKEQDSLVTEYHWQQQSKPQSFCIESTSKSNKIIPNSENEFITEHYWGYSKNSDSKTTQYEVTHPKWEIYDVLNYKITTDFALNYGGEFAYLNDAKPLSVMLAEGSAITIEGKSSI